MAKKENIIENPVTGEKIVFLETTGDTGGKYIRYEYYSKPKQPIAPEHIHPLAEERFEVVRGQVTYRINGKEQVRKPGETMVIPAGTRHTGWNSGDEELFMLSEIQPAMGFEDYYRTSFALSQQGKTNRQGLPGLLQLAVMGYEMKELMYLPKFIFFQKIFFNVIGPLARLLGYKSVYHKEVAG